MHLNKNSKINICYLVSRLRWFGPTFQLYNIIEHLDRQLFNPFIITLSPEAPDSLISVFKKSGVKIISIGLSRWASMFFGPKKIRDIFKEYPPHFIHTSDYRSTLLCAYSLTDTPRIVTCRQAFHHSHYSLGGEIGPIQSRFITKSLSNACKRCECLVAVSNYVRDTANNNINDNMEVIYNGVNQDLFCPVDVNEKLRLRSLLKLPIDKHIFISSGFLSRRKDPLTIINGFLKSKVSHESVLIFLGEGHLREKCLSMVDKRDNIFVIGFVENVRDYLAAADFFVSASLNEGCPNAVMEAMACGLPVILSDIPAHQELLNFNKEAGLVFSASNAESLSEMFTKIDCLNYSVRSQAALNIINEHGSAENMSLKYQQLYKQLYEKQQS